MKVEEHVEIAAPPSEVYDLISDVDRLGDWVSIHEWAESSSQGELKKGDELTQSLKLAGRPFTVHWKVVESDRPNRLVWEGRGPVRSKAKVVNELTATDKGTHFSYTNEFDLPGGPLGRVAGPMVKKVTGGELETSLARLKALLER